MLLLHCFPACTAVAWCAHLNGIAVSPNTKPVARPPPRCKSCTAHTVTAGDELLHPTATWQGLDLASITMLLARCAVRFLQVVPKQRDANAL
jgi:hypothetical protein